MTMIHKTSLKQHLTPLFSLNTVVLLSLSSAGLTVKAAFQLLSSHPCVRIFGFGSFPQSQQAQSPKASIVKLLKVSQIACDVQDHDGHEQMAVNSPYLGQ